MHVMIDPSQLVMVTGGRKRQVPMVEDSRAQGFTMW